MRPFVVSGGQTGVDRAALKVAIEKGLPYSGWCPLGGRAEDYPTAPGLLADYQLRPTPAAAGEQRTAWNVRDSHATLIISNGPSLDPSPGSLFTELCADLIFLRPYRVIDLDVPDPSRATTAHWSGALDITARWLFDLAAVLDTDPLILNFAGPRESESPGIHQLACDLIGKLVARIT
jgi:hypothetical protein